MNKKKGFTLIELIAVVTIIGVLALFALPTIEKLTKENEKKVYQQQLDNIILSLKSWASDNRIYLPEEENENLTITLGNLKSEGYIEYEVKNPLTGNCFDNSMALIITKVKKNYDYSIDLDTIKESNSCEVNLDSPIIALNGVMVENVEVNSIYVDKGVIAKDKYGNDITNNVVTTVSGSGNVVDTSKIGNQYIITYSVTDDDITVSISRTIKIVDTIAPELNIPSDVIIDLSVTDFDIMEGVSATDNSGENIEVSAKSNIILGKIGSYTITYTAIDSSGNKNVKNRVVSIQKFTNQIMSSDSNCITNANMICPNGTLVSVQVNETKIYDFYVIKDTGTNLTLIMDRNLGDMLAWINRDDYLKIEGSVADEWTNCNRNIYGPISLLKALEVRTSSWTNLPQLTISTFDYADGTEKRLGNNMEFKTYARLPRYSEISSLLDNNGLLPEYLYINLAGHGGRHDGYWMSTASTSNYNTCGIYGGAWTVDEQKIIFREGVMMDTNDSIRPVIELSK